jgi:hypothetical protein
MTVCRICESKLLPVPGESKPSWMWFCPKCKIAYYLGSTVPKGSVSIEPHEK